MRKRKIQRGKKGGWKEERKKEEEGRGKGRIEDIFKPFFSSKI